MQEFTRKSEAERGLGEKIRSLKVERKAVILAHNYQRAEVQDIADYVGDSFELSQIAAGTDASVIVFCGVLFMAETAAILSPEKLVLLPEIDAGCNLADMVTAEQLREKKKQLPGVAVVCYVNTSAEVKAECDACCTSANAVEIVDSIEAKEVLFVPDQCLGHFVALHVSKKVHLWKGFCPSHWRILPEDIMQRRKEYPLARVVVHTECTPQVIALADAALGTAGMIRYAGQEDVTQMVVGTELGMLHRLRKEYPHKLFVSASQRAICPNMKLITLESVLWSLQDLSPQISIPEEIRRKARISVDRMLELGRK